MLRLGLLSCLFLLLASRGGSAAPGGFALGFETLTAGLARPVGIESARDGSGRLFFVEAVGAIRVWDGTRLLPTPFLSLPVTCCGERGLLGLAFHPDYASNGFFYLHYSAPGPDPPAGTTVISRFTVSANDPNLADPASERVLLTQSQPFQNHNGGQLAFGRDGYLYIALGDGGSGGDPLDNARNLGTLLGKILRIDVDRTSPGLEYGIPAANPFTGVPGARGEIWAWGLRNPWRFSFDRTTGDLFIADVGQTSFEEIDFQPAGSRGGENYGWRLMEGSSCFNPPTGCDDGTLVLPILEYDHTVGCSVTGGFRYRGSRYPELRGVYLFGDFCSGRIWGATPGCGGAWHARELLDTPFNITSFGQGEDGELYFVEASNTDGKIHHLIVTGPTADLFASGFETGDTSEWDSCSGDG